MQSLLTSDDNCHYEAVARYISKGFYISELDVLGQARWFIL